MKGLEKNGGKTDYSRITSRQIAVYKTDKALLELVDRELLIRHTSMHPGKRMRKDIP